MCQKGRATHSLLMYVDSGSSWVRPGNAAVPGNISSAFPGPILSEQPVIFYLGLNARYRASLSYEATLIEPK